MSRNIVHFKNNSFSHETITISGYTSESYFGFGEEYCFDLVDLVDFVNHLLLKGVLVSRTDPLGITVRQP